MVRHHGFEFGIEINQQPCPEHGRVTRAPSTVESYVQVTANSYFTLPFRILAGYYMTAEKLLCKATVDGVKLPACEIYRDTFNDSTYGYMNTWRDIKIQGEWQKLRFGPLSTWEAHSGDDVDPEEREQCRRMGRIECTVMEARSAQVGEERRYPYSGTHLSENQTTVAGPRHIKKMTTKKKGDTIKDKKNDKSRDDGHESDTDTSETPCVADKSLEGRSLDVCVVPPGSEKPAPPRKRRFSELLDEDGEQRARTAYGTIHRDEGNRGQGRTVTRRWFQYENVPLVKFVLFYRTEKGLLDESVIVIDDDGSDDGSVMVWDGDVNDWTRARNRRKAEEANGKVDPVRRKRLNGSAPGGGGEVVDLER
ncbi:MAG: hypothetical protein Q9227_000734 [Pyrenula ochraceoflavens]